MWLLFIVIPINQPTPAPPAGDKERNKRMDTKEIKIGTKVIIKTASATAALKGRRGTVVDINYTWHCPYKVDLGYTSHREPVPMVLNFREDEFEIVEE